MSFAAVAIGGAAVIGAGASAYGAHKQSAAGKYAANLQMGTAARTEQLLDPWRYTGVNADLALQEGLGVGAHGQQFNPQSPLMKPFSLADFQQSPAYQFNLQQGQMAIDKGANARGNLYAPQTLQDLSKFSQGLASNEFNNAYNMYNQNQQNQFSRLYALSGQGANAAAGIGGFNAGAASGAGNFLTSAGAAQAGGIQGAGMSLSQLAYLPQILAQQQQSGTSWNPAGNFGYDPTGGYGAQNMYMGPPQ